VDEARRDEILDDLMRWTSTWLDRARERFVSRGETFDIGVIGVAFDMRFEDGTSDVGYTCSEGRPWVHAGLFRAAMLEAESSEDYAPDTRDVSPSDS